MSDNHLPGVAHKPVDLGAAQHAVIRAPITGPLHVLEIHCASHVLADHGKKVLDPALAGADPRNRPIQALGDIVPAALSGEVGGRGIFSCVASAGGLGERETAARL